MNPNPDINNALAHIGSDNQLIDLFNLEEIQRLQDLFADVNGVASLITLPDGTPITRPSKFTHFCNDIIRGTDKGCSNCNKSDQLIGRHNPDGPNIQICLSGGLWDAGSGITVGGKHIANWIIGQVRNGEIDEQRLQQQAQEIGANDQEYIEAYKKVPVMSVEQFRKVSNLLFEFANNLSDKAYNNLQLKKQIFDHEKTIELLRESEENLRYIIKHDPNAIAVYDCNLNYIAVSDRYLHDYNVMEDNILGKHHYEVFPEMPQKWKDVHQRCLAGAIEINEDDSFVRPDGSITYNRWECRPWRKVNGKIGGIIMYTEVTTGRKKAEKALLQGEEKYRYLFANNPQPMWIYDLETMAFLEVNDAAINQFGYSREEFMLMTLKDILPDEDFNALLNVIEQRLPSFNQSGEFRHIRKNGKIILFEITSHSVLFNGRNARLVLGKDITKNKQAEKSLQESEERFRHSFEYAASGICIVGIDGKFQRINSAFKEMIGYDEEELRNLTFTDITHPDDRSIGLTQLKRLLNGEIDHASFEKRYIRKDNRIIWTYLSTSLIWNANHEPQYFITQTIDITERKQAEKEITMLAHALKSINECVSISDLDDKIIFINESFSRTYGYDMNELIGKQIGIIRFKKNWQALDHEISKATMKGEWQGELLNKKKDGSEFPVFLSTSTIKDKDNKALGLIGVATDITERKRADESLLKLSRAIEQTINTIIITDRNGNIEYVNHAFEVLSGYSLKEALGKTPRILKSGTKDQKYYVEMWKTILSGKVYRQEIVNKKKNGELYFVEKTISPIFDQNKTITHFVGTGVDITERKLAEKELIAAKEKAEESDRLKSSFLANMSHEVRTPLNSIIGFSKLLADSNFDDEQRNEFIKIIIANGNHLLTIISDIMDISKLESGEIKINTTQINAWKFILSVMEQFSIHAETIKLELKLTCPEIEEETIIFADIDRLNQIFNNLISNALKFTIKGHIEIGYQPFGELVEFYVKDTGIGIPTEYHSKIFDRFRQVETEKTRNYDGNGLGLAITKNLVELMDGKIWVESKSGKGSVFYFTLPTSKNDPEYSG